MLYKYNPVENDVALAWLSFKRVVINLSTLPV